MPEVLSQSQIDALLKELSSGSLAAEEMDAMSSGKKVKEYDFRSPKKFTKEQLKTMNSIHENYSRLLSSYFTGILRLFSQVSVLSIEEQRYFDYNNALPDNVFVGIIDMKPSNTNLSDCLIMVEISKNISFAIIDRLLGGTGETLDDDREFTEIEITLMEHTLRQMLRMLKESWSNYIEVDPILLSIETNSRLIQTIGPDEIIVIVVLEAVVRGQKGTITICLPAINLEELMSGMSSKNLRLNRKVDEFKEAIKRDTILAQIKESTMEVKGTLGTVELTLSDILNLQVDDIIKLDKDISSDITVSVGKYEWFTGKLGVRKGKKAIKINRVMQGEDVKV
ncbi:MAG TPA: flagellar motor switch protein FliM [Ruminococcaceae bacterium]|nr:flagellar motor switch protein FliM [Oscillospiraceae bacterium]